jgi:uncharacterized repeat protein (TIGR02543 family)
MKHKFLKRLVVASISISTLIFLAPVEAKAAWIKNYDGNWLYTEGYGFATGWKQINGTWYYFDSNGLMRTGWINDGGDWYYADLNGAMQKGVIQIEGKIHLFAQSGAMQKGVCMVDGKLYNFDDNGICIDIDAPTPVRAFDYYGNSTIPFVPSQIVDENSVMSSDIPSNGKKQVKQYKIKFKDPEADDEDEELLKTRTADENTLMSLYKPTKSGYTFVEWNTKEDGDGTSYNYDDKITVRKDMTLYAQWEENADTTTDEDEVIKVKTISVNGSNSISQITAKGVVLQMVATLSPGDATNRKVTWSVTNGTDTNKTGQASISSTGLLTPLANGQVTVRATATDGSGVYGEKVVTISGQ